MATKEKLPGALKVPGGIQDSAKIIHRRRCDDLPDHVKGTVTFHVFKDENDRHKPITGYYTNDDQRRVAVELLKDEEHEDAWYILDQESTGCFVTNRHNRLNLYTRGTGYWYIYNLQHPNYLPDPPAEEEAPQPHEEFIAGGLHHVTTLEGPQAQLSPTHLILDHIEQAAIQGEAIPVDIQPIASTSQVVINPAPQPTIIIQQPQPPAMAQPAQITMQLAQPVQQQVPAQVQQQVQQPVQQQAQQPAQAAVAHVRNGAFKGSAPPIFKGERSESTKFLIAFRIFCVAN